MAKYKRVLLVDDDPAAIYILRTILKKMDIAEEICVAPNGEEAMNIVLNAECHNLQHPEIIFLDINMPIINGFEFVALFNTLDLKNKVEIVILTSSENEKDIKKMEDLGINKILHKPITHGKVMSSF
jgi:CheY-like chemotaxis protein